MPKKLKDVFGLKRQITKHKFERLPSEAEILLRTVFEDLLTKPPTLSVVALGEGPHIIRVGQRLTIENSATRGLTYSVENIQLIGAPLKLTKPRPRHGS